MTFTSLRLNGYPSQHVVAVSPSAKQMPSQLTYLGKLRSGRDSYMDVPEMNAIAYTHRFDDRAWP